jgi:hypothetical protein
VTWLNHIQWPAMALTVLAAWMVASQSPRRRSIGFWVFLASNVAWVAWGIYAKAYALIVLQVCLLVLNIRGVKKNDELQDQAQGAGTS